MATGLARDARKTVPAEQLLDGEFPHRQAAFLEYAQESLDAVIEIRLTAQEDKQRETAPTQNGTQRMKIEDPSASEVPPSASSRACPQKLGGP
jgi:hypothetical protein